MGRKRTSLIWNVSKQKIIEVVKKSLTQNDVLRYFGLQHKGGNFRTFKKRCEEDGIDLSKFKNNYGSGQLRAKIPLEEVLVENSDYNRGALKKRLLKNGMLKNECDWCGLGPEWRGETLVLVLDHINGINNDNRLKNLRLLCPNCNSQTSTFAGRKLRIKNYCLDCKCEIHRKSKRCVSCQNESRRKVERPSKEQLEVFLQDKPMTHLAKDLGVSDKTIAKWVIGYG